MKVISLYQPYATLMVLGLKTNETRSWSTDYRGPILIHATKNSPKWCKDLLKQEPFKTALAGIDLPTGCIVGQVEIVDMMKTERWEYLNANDFLKGTPDEWWYGDYSLGRWAWQTKNPVQFAEPIPAKGSQGFWSYDLASLPATKNPPHENAIYLPVCGS